MGAKTNIYIFVQCVCMHTHTHIYECYLLIKRPLEECVAVSSHHHKKQGQVGATARPVTIQVDPQTHLVAIFTGIKGWKTL